MTEKEFNITTDDDNFIRITQEDEELNQLEVCDLLNILSTENRQLKQKLCELTKERDSVKKTINDELFSWKHDEHYKKIDRTAVIWALEWVLTVFQLEEW